MRYSKIKKVKSPQRGTPKSAGIDFFIPEDFPTYRLIPYSDVLIHSGIKMDIPKGYMLMGADKSSIATKKMLLGAKIVDEDYQGELLIHVINLSRETITLEAGMKIAQFILVPVLYADLEEVPEEALFTERSERGAGGFGSTGGY